MTTIPPAPRSPSMPAEEPGSSSQDAKLWSLRIAKAFVVFVYVVVLVNLVTLTLGFFLSLLGASTDAEFTQWVYRGVDRVMQPFRGMFPNHELSGESVLDTSLLFAMIVYSIAALAIHTLVVWLTDRIVTLRRRQQVAWFAAHDHLGIHQVEREHIAKKREYILA